MDLTQPERQFLDALLAGSQPALVILREQLDSARVERRQLTDIGFFTHFAVPSRAPRLPVRHWVLGDVGITHPALPHGGGALLFVRDGALSLLEAYSYTSDAWPDGDGRFKVAYLTYGRALGHGAHQLENSAERDEAWLAADYAAAEHRSVR